MGLVSGGRRRAQPAPGLTVDDCGLSVVGWSADGRQLFVHTGTEVPARIERIDVETGQRSCSRRWAPQT